MNTEIKFAGKPRFFNEKKGNVSATIPEGQVEQTDKSLQASTAAKPFYPVAAAPTKGGEECK
jgi:hypothetical protein